MSELYAIGHIARNERDEVIIKKGKYWNVEVLDIRWYSNDKPSRKGIRLNMEEAKKLLEILRREIDDEN
tara:strand:+ start:10732 stop:10938 length:207 start_codon:yes stop_codon:yes gene_type:complete